MTILFIIILGALVGVIASNTSAIRGSGYGLWWDIYLGIAGSTLGNLLIIYAYFMNVFPLHLNVGVNFPTVITAIAGAMGLIKLAELHYKKYSLFSKLTINPMAKSGFHLVLLK